jgi:hypothetical protein
MARQGQLNVYGPNSNDPNFSVPNNTPTLKLDPTMYANSAIPVSGIRCVNVIGAGAVKIQSSSLVVNQQLMILNTQGSKPVFISLDNNGLVGGVLSFGIGSGSSFSFIYDGVNLVQQA